MKLTNLTTILFLLIANVTTAGQDSPFERRSDSVPYQVSCQLIRINPMAYAGSGPVVFQIPDSFFVQITITDSLDQTIFSLPKSLLATGEYEYWWNRLDNNGEKVELGIYNLHLAASSKSGSILFDYRQKYFVM